MINNDLKVTTIDDLKEIINKNPNLQKSIPDISSYEFKSIAKSISYIDTFDYDKFNQEMMDSYQAKTKQEQDFHKNTKTIAENTTASALYTKQILETNEQLLNYNKLLTQQLDRINYSLSNLTSEFIDRYRVSQLIELDKGEKLQEMITVLKNPTDESMFDKFEDLPPQVVIGLVLQAMIQVTGLG